MTKKLTNYWNSCPLKNEYLPVEDCPEGTPEKDGNRILKPGNCAWWINSKKHNFCFWKYLRDNSNQDGSTREHSPAEIADLLGVDLIQANTLILNATNKITQLFDNYKLNEELIAGSEYYSVSTKDLIDSNENDYE